MVRLSSGNVEHGINDVLRADKENSIGLPDANDVCWSSGLARTNHFATVLNFSSRITPSTRFLQAKSVGRQAGGSLEATGIAYLCQITSGPADFARAHTQGNALEIHRQSRIGKRATQINVKFQDVLLEKITGGRTKYGISAASPVMSSLPSCSIYIVCVWDIGPRECCKADSSSAGCTPEQRGLLLQAIFG